MASWQEDFDKDKTYTQDETLPPEQKALNGLNALAAGQGVASLGTGLGAYLLPKAAQLSESIGEAGALFPKNTKLYHGSQSEFMGTPTPSQGSGLFWTTPDKMAASRYAEQVGREGPASVRSFEAPNEYTDLTDLTDPIAKQFKEAVPGELNFSKVEQNADLLKSLGVQALKVPDVAPATRTAGPFAHESYAFFNPETLKPAYADGGLVQGNNSMKPDELVKYLQMQDPETHLPMDSKMATGQMPGVPALPGMSEDSGHSRVKSPYPPLEGSGPNEEEELFSDGGQVSVSSGTSTNADMPQESPIIVKLRELLMGKKGDLMADQNQVQKADQVDNSYCSGGKVGYSDGGTVDKVKDYLSKAYGKAKKGPMIPDSTLAGFQNLVSSPTAQAPTPPQAPGMAMGGFSDDPLLSPAPANFAQALNPASIPQPTFNPRAGLPPTPPPAPVAPVQPQAATPVISPTGPTPQIAPNGVNPAAQYFQGQHNAINSYGPEQQLALQKALIQQRSGLAGRAPVALGGLADALMQGVARAGNPGFADRIQGQQNELAKEQIGGLENAGKTNKENVEANAQIDAMDPRSVLSQTIQKSYGKLLKGFTPDQIANMSAKNISDITGKSVDTLKAESEAKMAAATLGLHSAELQNNIRHQGVEEGLNKEAKVQEAGKELAAHPIQRMLGILPGQSGLEQVVNGGNASATDTAFTPDVLSYAQTHGISPQQAAAVKKARTGGI